MADKKFSEFTLLASAVFAEEVVGLSTGDNARWTWQSIYDLFQETIGDVTPLPAGTNGKVMYYYDGNWGASNEFITDGSNVNIGTSTIDPEYRLLVRDDLNTYNITYSSLNGNGRQGLTKHGISFFTNSLPTANINQESNEGVYRAYFGEGKSIFGGDILMNTEESSALRYGTFDVTTGNFTETSSYFLDGSGNNNIRADVTQVVDSGDEVLALFTTYGTIKSIISDNANAFQLWSDSASAASGIILGTETLSAVPPTAIKSLLHIGGGNADMLNALTVAYSEQNDAGFSDDTTFFKLTKEGKFFVRLPAAAGANPTAGSTFYQVYVDGGIMKVG